MIDISTFKAIIFDMDGVLIDSEPLWKIAMEEVFVSIGCPLTRKDFQKTVGLRLDEVIDYWYAHTGWENTSSPFPRLDRDPPLPPNSPACCPWYKEILCKSQNHHVAKYGSHP